jgi:hypothetical protein
VKHPDVTNPFEAVDDEDFVRAELLREYADTGVVTDKMRFWFPDGIEQAAEDFEMPNVWDAMVYKL